MSSNISSYKSDFLQTLAARGYLHQLTDADGIDALAQKGITAYVGVDLTGPSLHIGHLLPIMMLRRLQQAGGKPIALMGGGTTKIGDPSGKDTQRQILTPETIAANKESIFRIYSRFLTFGEGPSDALVVDNAEWLDGLNYIAFLRDYGRHFSVNRMLSMDSVKTRLEREQPLSFLEFNYMCLQSYDFVELHRRYQCRLQMGGSDQWGNITQGVELGRRVNTAELFGLTAPLITTADGKKMGKTAGGAVWLNRDMLSDWDYWQYWRNTDDRDVGRFLKLFTDLPLAEIARLEALEGAEINAAKIVLANEATALCRGRAAAEEAAKTAEQTFAGGAGEALPKVALPGPTPLVEALVLSGLVKSKKEARRKLAEGAVRLDDAPVTDAEQIIATAAKLSVGKKRHALLAFEG